MKHILQVFWLFYSCILSDFDSEKPNNLYLDALFFTLSLVWGLPCIFLSLVLIRRVLCVQVRFKYMYSNGQYGTEEQKEIV